MSRAGLGLAMGYEDSESSPTPAFRCPGLGLNGFYDAEVINAVDGFELGHVTDVSRRVPVDDKSIL